MMYKITKGDIFEDNPELRSIEKYAVCSSRDLKYIFLVYDYKSPYRNLPIEQRKLKALLEAGFKMERDGTRPDKNARDVSNGKIDKINEAIKEFLSQQRDEDQELGNAVDSQISEIRNFLKRPKETEGEWRIAISLIEKLPKILKDRNQIFEILELRDNLEASLLVQEKEEQPVSTLEQYNDEFDAE